VQPYHGLNKQACTGAGAPRRTFGNATDWKDAEMRSGNAGQRKRGCSASKPGKHGDGVTHPMSGVRTGKAWGGVANIASCFGQLIGGIFCCRFGRLFGKRPALQPYGLRATARNIACACLSCCNNEADGHYFSSKGFVKLKCCVARTSMSYAAANKKSKSSKTPTSVRGNESPGFAGKLGNRDKNILFTTPLL